MTDLTIRMPFGNTRLRVTALAIGTSTWGQLHPGETGEERDLRVASMADAFLEGSLPSNLLDTSNIYGASQAEAHIGQALERAGGLPPGSVLQTKLDRDLVSGDFSGERMWRSLEESLSRLGVAKLQVLYLHDPELIGFDTAMASGGPVDALVEMKEQGIAHAIGISGGPVDMLQRFVETDVFDALITHNRFTLVDRSASTLLDSAAHRRMGVANAAPYGAGVLTGDPKFSGYYAYKPIRPEVRAAVDAMTVVCRDAGVPLGAAALQFSLRDPRVHATIVGGSRRGRFDDAFAHATHPIPDGLWAELDRLVPPAYAAVDAPM